MNKEEILETLKELILSLINDKEIFAKDALMVTAWQNKQVSVGDEIVNLSPEDRTWLDEEYEKWWASANISSDIEPITPKTS